MPERKTVQQAEEKKRRGRAPSTQAGEFVREEIHHIRAGKHGARSTKQAIAIGLSKARRAGVQVPKKGGSRSQNSPDSSTSNRFPGSRSTPRGRRESSPRRARATLRALQRESRGAASHRALARQGRQAARQRSSADRSASARQAVRTKGAAGRSAAARKAARTRAAT